MKNIYFEKIIPRLDVLFSEFANDDFIFRIDKLDLELGNIAMDKFEQQFIDSTLDSIRKSLEKKKEIEITDHSMGWAPMHRSMTGALIFFLEFGCFPWWSMVHDLKSLEMEIRNQPSSHPSLKTDLSLFLKNHPAAVKRLSFQASEPFLNFLIQLYFPSLMWGHLLRETVSFFSGIPGFEADYLHDLFWETAFTKISISGERIHVEIINEVLTQLAQKRTLTLDERETFVHVLDKIIYEKEPDRPKEKIYQTADEKTFQNAKAEDLNEGTSGIDAVVQADRSSHSSSVKPMPSPPETIIEREYNESKPITEQTAFANEINVTGTAETRKEEKKEVQMPLSGKEPSLASERNIEGRSETGISEKGRQENKKEGRRVKTDKPDIPRLLNDGLMIYPELSGLVILHPFLPAFFETLNLTDGKRFVDEESVHKAVALLGYLATGEKEMEEQRLVIPKLFCGMEIPEPVKKTGNILPREQEEAEKLLLTVVDHWTALKSTSVDGLRNTFLKREGKLGRTDNGWNLEIEHKTWDILLNRIPWGFSIIKFPWMKELLFVKWN